MWGWCVEMNEMNVCFIVPVEKEVRYNEIEKRLVEVLRPRVAKGGYVVIKYIDNDTKAIIKPSRTAFNYLIKRKYATMITIPDAAINK